MAANKNPSGKRKNGQRRPAAEEDARALWEDVAKTVKRHLPRAYRL